MKLALLAVWLLTSVALFRTYPADEAAVRAAVIGVAYVLAYVVVSALVTLTRAAWRRLQNGR